MKRTEQDYLTTVYLSAHKAFIKKHPMVWANLDYAKWKKQLAEMGLLTEWMAFLSTFEIPPSETDDMVQFAKDIGLIRELKPDKE